MSGGGVGGRRACVPPPPLARSMVSPCALPRPILAAEKAKALQARTRQASPALARPRARVHTEAIFHMSHI